MGAYDDRFGSILIGSWLSSMLYALVVTQAYQYFRLFPTDAMYRKGLVLSTLFFCTPTVTFWGNAEKVNIQYWPVPLFVTTSTFVGVLVNSFLIHRFYSLSKNLCTSIFLSLLMILGFAGSFMVAITLQQFSLYTSRDKAKTAALVWTVFNGADRYWYCGCSNLATTFDEELVQRNAVNDSNIPTACNFVIAPLYALTLLSKLQPPAARRPCQWVWTLHIRGEYGPDGWYP
ncbi:hypothetical protein B0H14DRAFT_3470343 [Mycena olivaceomarginata]|nr:hypothetical protein B0H14DRAFT_3470343 [Mycena olivaceomarginata]